MFQQTGHAMFAWEHYVLQLTYHNALHVQSISMILWDALLLTAGAGLRMSQLQRRKGPAGINKESSVSYR